MPDLSPLYALLGLLPLDCLQPRFMQQALLALLLLTPMAAVLGVQVINFRMAFFSDAIGHSAFAGVALGLMLSVDPRLSMPLFGVLVGLAVMTVRRKSNLSADTAIGIVFSAVVAFGLAVVSRASGVARDMQQFLYGDILTISEGEILFLGLLFLLTLIFQAVGYNRLLSIALNPVMARVHGVRVALWQYLFAILLALVVMFSVWAVGVLLVHAHRTGGDRAQSGPHSRRHVLVGAAGGRQFRLRRACAFRSGLACHGQRGHRHSGVLLLVRGKLRVDRPARSPPCLNAATPCRPGL